MRPGTNIAYREPGAMTTGSDMRGSTLLLHCCSEATLIESPTPKRPSSVEDRRPCTNYRLADIIGRLLFFIDAGYMLLLWVQYNGDGKKMQVVKNLFRGQNLLTGKCFSAILVSFQNNGV